MSSEPEIAKNGRDAAGVPTKPQLRVDESGSVPSPGFTEHRSSITTVEEARVPLGSGTEQLSIASKSSESAEVVERPVAVSELPQTVISATDADPADPTFAADHNVVKENREDEICSGRTNRDLVHDDGLDERLTWDAVDGKHGPEESESESTPKNELSLQEEDVSVHLDKVVSENQTSSTLSGHSGTKTSPVHEKPQPPEAELRKNGMPAADVGPDVHKASPRSAHGDTGLGREDKDLAQSQRSREDDVSKSSHSARSDGDVQSVSSAGGRRSSSSRRSASGASRAGSGSSNAVPAVGSSHSESADDVSSRSDGVRSSVSSRERTVDGSRSGSISTKSDVVHGEVSGCVESVDGQSGSRTNSIHSGVSSKTFTIDSEGSGKARQGSDDVAVPENAGRHTVSDVLLRQGDVGADTDDDVADLEPDLSLHTKPAEDARGIVDNTSAAAEPGISPAEAGAAQEVRLDEDVANLKDERMPEELDNDLDFSDGGHGLIRGSEDAGNLQRHTPEEPRSDTSESRTGRNSDDLHRIIRRAAAAVESFVAEGGRSSAKVGEERLSDDRSVKLADDAAQNLLSDAIDQMLAVRKQKVSVASKSSTAPAAVPLSPSALSDNAKSTASTSSDGQVDR